MENIASDFFNIFRFLLPGFLAAWVFYGLSAYERPHQFERIIQAFIFTLAVQFLVSIFAIYYFTQFATVEPQAKLPIYIETVVSVLSALLVGLIFAILANKDWLHFALRKCHLTEQTSYPSEWFGAFTTQKTFVVLHMIDERRLYGWPKEWPQSSDKGHFFVISASWLPEEGNEQRLEEKGVEGILIDVKSVVWVEFMKGEKYNG